MKNIRLSFEWLRIALLQVKFHALWPTQRLFTIVMSLKRKRSILSIKDKNEVADDILYSKKCRFTIKCFLNLISFTGFCSSLIFIFSITWTLNYPEQTVPTSLDNRGSTVEVKCSCCISPRAVFSVLYLFSSAFHMQMW